MDVHTTLLHLLLVNTIRKRPIFAIFELLLFYKRKKQFIKLLNKNNISYIMMIVINWQQCYCYLACHYYFQLYQSLRLKIPSLLSQSLSMGMRIFQNLDKGIEILHPSFYCSKPKRSCIFFYCQIFPNMHKIHYHVSDLQPYFSGTISIRSSR